MRSLGWVLSSLTGVLIKMGNSDTEIHTEDRRCEDIQGEDGHVTGVTHLRAQVCQEFQGVRDRSPFSCWEQCSDHIPGALSWYIPDGFPQKDQIRGGCEPGEAPGHLPGWPRKGECGICLPKNKGPV